MSSAGTRAPSASRAIPPTRSSASISPASTPRRTGDAGLPARALRDRRATEGRFEREGWRVRKDGTRFWAHVVIDPIREPTGELVGYRQDHPRPHRAKGRPRRSLRRSEEQFRLLVQGVTDYAIYMLDPHGHVVELERRRPAHQGLRAPTRSSASISRASTPTRTARPACPSARSGHRRARGPVRGGRLARAQGRHPLLGPCRHRRDPRRRRQVASASPRSPATSPSGARPSAQLEQAREALLPVAEDGGDRPAHRRRRARLQQPADGRARQPRAAAQARGPDDPRIARLLDNADAGRRSAAPR